MDDILRCLHPEREDGYRHGTVILGGGCFHIEAVRVVEDDDGIQSALNPTYQFALDRIDDGSALASIRLDGSEGQWVVCITPFRV